MHMKEKAITYCPFCGSDRLLRYHEWPSLMQVVCEHCHAKWPPANDVCASQRPVREAPWRCEK